MVKKKGAAKQMAKKKPAPKKLQFKNKYFSKKMLTVFGGLFAAIGIFVLIKSFAATAYVNYYGALTASNPSAQYKLTTGAGPLEVSFSNNTADVILTIKGSDGAVIGTVKSVGKKDVKFNATIKAGTYTFALTTEKAFNQKKGYSIKISYPEVDSTGPSVIITEPFNKESVSGTANITATVNDENGVAKVDMYANGKIIKNDTVAPWTTRWDTRQFADGQVEILVRAYDSSGNMSEASGTILVDNIKDAAETAKSRFPGDPNPKVTKKAYWGASIAGNGDPSRHESVTGTSLSVRRTFYQWADATNTNSSMYKTIADDLANNRLPFVSSKMPSWSDVGSGKYDAQLDAMLKKLDSYGKPVWFVAHHEPEGGGASGNTPDDAGGPSAWREMQKRIRQRMNALGTKNVAFMPVVMTYTWNSASKRNPDDWWVDGIWDAYCVDHYQTKESSNMVDGVWGTFLTWIEKKGLPYCIGEWGNTGTDTQAGQEMKDFWNWTFNNKKDLIAYSYFDSNLNSSQGGWELKGEPLNVFREILKSDAKVQRINDL